MDSLQRLTETIIIRRKTLFPKTLDINRDSFTFLLSLPFYVQKEKAKRRRKEKALMTTGQAISQELKRTIQTSKEGTDSKEDRKRQRPKDRIQDYFKGFYTWNDLSL